MAFDFLSRSVNNENVKVILQLNEPLVRPHVECVERFWSPHHRMDMDSLQSIQRRMAEAIPGIRSLPYKDR